MRDSGKVASGKIESGKIEPGSIEPGRIEPGRIEIVGPRESKDAFVRHLNASQHPILLLDARGRVIGATNGTQGPSDLLPDIAALHHDQ